MTIPDNKSATSDDLRASEEVCKLLLSEKYRTLHTYFTTGMTWWVSAVVFSGSILIGTWANNGKVVQLAVSNPFVSHVIFCLVTLFFATVIGYGGWCIHSLEKLKTSVSEIIASISRDSAVKHTVTIPEFTLISVAYVIGTSSFVLILVIWLVTWIKLT